VFSRYPKIFTNKPDLIDLLIINLLEQIKGLAILSTPEFKPYAIFRLFMSA